MRNFIICKYRYQAVRAYPGAAKIVKVEGGFMCFETLEEYKIWRNQK